uniref:LOW QUALITY PROTEIN: olfactory receptor-like protein OLF1 n=1 Tax=Odobenus rosmarus divergens TaxID=9708 RepID=UPI00063CBEA8|nr:PREDICTED: LOW QUALITY PROTEIN: olfactory receptor-like protein OLF1 [Odobenus rosmarus divergens]
MELMDGNYTLVTEFILLGFPTHPELQIVLFLMFLTLYGMSLRGNIGLMMLIRIDPHLRTPMYFFLSHLSFADLCYSSVIVPKMLFNFLRIENKAISCYGCALQFYFFCTFADTESFIFAAMACDCYVAICNPLLFTAVMSRSICTRLIVLSYIGGTMSSLVYTSFAFILKYYDKNVINHFFCDFPPLPELSCTDTSVNEWLLCTYSGSVEIICFTVIIISYFFILRSVSSSSGRKKTFSTCASPLTSVANYQGTLLFIDSPPSYLYSPNTDKIISGFYTVIIPVLNLLIYSLRNKDVKDATKRAIRLKVDSL